MKKMDYFVIDFLAQKTEIYARENYTVIKDEKIKNKPQISIPRIPETN